MPHTNKDLFSLLLENLPDHAIFMSDTQGRVLTWALGVSLLFGYDENEFVGQNASLLFLQKDQSAGALPRDLEEAAREGRTQNARWQRRKDESLFWANYQVVALRDGGSTVEGFAHIIRDDTARKRTEVDLCEAQERLQTAFNVGRIGTWMWDIQNDRVHADINLSRFFELSPEESKGVEIARFIQAIHPDDAPGVESAVSASLQTGAVFDVEYRVLQKDKSLLWLEARGKIDFDAHGQPLQLNGIIFDITERKQSDAALRQSEERYRTLFEAIDSGFCVVEMIFDDSSRPIDYRFLEINPAFESQTGLKHAIGKTAKELVPDLGNDWFTIYGKVALTGEATRFENNSEAMHRWFDVYAFRVGDPKLRRIAILFSDITERKQGEEALRVAQFRAEETSRLKDEFLATLSHELRSPLNAILGWANLLRSGQLDAESQAKGLETVERNAQAQAQLIEDLLDVSRILTGKLRLEKRPVKLSDILTNALKNASPATQAKKIQIRTSFDHPIRFIAGDPDRLEQVFSNLLSNAIKFTPEGGLITIGLSMVDSQVEVKVTDTGKGITPEFLPYVFERFRQADASPTRTNGGLGIGLGLVRSLVEAHGGTVRANSEGEGRGSTFTATFPAIKMHAAPVENPTAKITSAAASKQLSGFRVLLVDDEPDARIVATIALKQNGAIVEVVDTAAAAFAKIEASRQAQQPFDVFVSDIGMPEENGLSLMGRIRKLEAEQGGFLPSAALTAYASQKDIATVIEAGFQAHISKPVDIAELVKTVVELKESASVN